MGFSLHRELIDEDKFLGVVERVTQVPPRQSFGTYVPLVLGVTIATTLNERDRIADFLLAGSTRKRAPINSRNSLLIGLRLMLVQHRFSPDG